MIHSQYLRRLFLSVLVAGGLAPLTVQANPVTVLDAATVLPAEMLEGPNFWVDPEVRNDGLVNTYRVKTKYGTLEIEGSPLLFERIGELRGLDQIEKLEKSEVYQSALKAGAKSPLRGAEALIDNPVGAVTGAAKGIGRWMSDIGRAATSGDPHQAGVTETALGQATAKRAFAYQFGVDPYTRFKPLQKSLDELGWAAAGGGLTTKVALAFLPGTMGTVVAATGTTDSMKALVRDKSPAQLDSLNRDKLRAMGVPRTGIDAFLDNPVLSPQDKTIIVGELETLKGSKGRAAFVAAAARAEDEAMSLFMRYRAQMIGRFASEKGAVESFVRIDRTLFVRTWRGEIVGLFPIDRIAYDEEMKEKLAVLDRAIGKLNGVHSKQLWIGGPVDPAAREHLQARGWTVRDRLFEKIMAASRRE